jgi:ADP-ribose pyrophosphatase
MATQRWTHHVARGPHPRYPKRFEVPDERVSWDEPWDEYEPVEFVTDKVLAQSPDRLKTGWADRDEPPTAEVLKARGSHELQAMGKPWRFAPATQRPMNPRGRTGLQNRGTLGKWGPNHAGDAIVTRYNVAHPDQPLEFVAIRRKDTGLWALPGGMVDPGEIAQVRLPPTLLPTPSIGPHRAPPTLMTWPASELPPTRGPRAARGRSHPRVGDGRACAGDAAA